MMVVDDDDHLCDIFFSDADGRDDVDHVAMLALLGKQDTLLLKDDADQDDDEDVDDDHQPAGKSR